ncbi:kinase [Winogradskyella echinorum]|uniref:Kinase n=1 Tax=Winogradskyella echinorum TaxID=538189 RepID=A0ABR6Y384_9FLAO|nr:kinase [Winogradskyella echinorum]MBC3847206.1 kinase [Winogradskyella echinorum]MBC5751554.1 kinase [Winogradskyella echinorum]
MDKLLYFPYINLPKTDWTVRTLLYYDNISSIVPQEYFYSPERNYEPFMLELVRSELVIPINPIEVLEKPWEISKPFIKFLEKNEKRLLKKRENFILGRRGKIHIGKFFSARIHVDKFDGEIFYQLEQLGLAERDNGQWYSVEKNTANHLMNYLATIISTKLEMRPTTDNFKKSYYSYKDIIENKKRQTILSNLIPFPEEIDLNKIRRFKDKHNDLLKAFKNRIEQLVLDENLINGTDLFKLKIEELTIRKDELSAKMNESQINNIIFGSVCGIIGAVQGLKTAETTGALIGALPGFVSAVHSALKVEKAENLFDQSGMKYLALVDKRIRR